MEKRSLNVHTPLRDYDSRKGRKELKMAYAILADDRRKVVERLEELTGKKAIYTRVPRCAYILNGIAVEKNRTVTTEEDADIHLLNLLIRDGLIEGEIQEEYTEPDQVETAEQATPQELEDNQTEEDQTEEDHAEDYQTEEDQTENYQTEDYQTEDYQTEEDHTEVVEVGNSPTEHSGPVKPKIIFPLSLHRPESICNLVYTIYSRGKLMSKSTGGDFSVSERLVEELQDFGVFTCKKQVIEVIRRIGEDELHGLSFDEEKVVFDGFPETDDAAEIKAWTKLSAAINKNAIRRMHVYAKDVDDTNEKFTFRTWLTRLGLNGPDLKQERNILYRNLSGHTAFRTARDEEKWKARQAIKRAAMKAQKAELSNGAED